MTTRLRPLGGALLPLFVLATSTACEFSKQLGDDASATGPGDDGAGDEQTTETEGVGDIPVDQAAVTMATARCAAWLGCECNLVFDDLLSETMEDCVANLQPYYDEQIAMGQAQGLQYDPSCVAATIEYYEAPGCLPTTDATIGEYFDVAHCDLFHGDAQVGEACTGEFFVLPTVESCAPGLLCVNGFCEAMKGEGEQCNGAASPQNDCVYPLFCDAGQAPPRCAPRATVGEHCDDDELCAGGLWCDDETCAAPTPAGEQCLDARECGFGECGSDMTCHVTAAVCGPIVIEVQTQCDVAQISADEFIAANSDCDVAEDCVAVDALCAEANTCGSIALNAGYDAEAWMQIAAQLDSQCSDCQADPCGFAVACNDGTCGFSP